MKIAVFLVIILTAAGFFVLFFYKPSSQTFKDLIRPHGEPFDTSRLSIIDSQRDNKQSLYCQRVGVNADNTDDYLVIQGNDIRFSMEIPNWTFDIDRYEGMFKEGQMIIWDDTQGTIFIFSEKTPDEIRDSIMYGFDRYTFSCQYAQIEKSIFERPRKLQFVMTYQ